MHVMCTQLFWKAEFVFGNEKLRNILILNNNLLDFPISNFQKLKSDCTRANHQFLSHLRLLLHMRFYFWKAVVVFGNEKLHNILILNNNLLDFPISNFQKLKSDCIKVEASFASHSENCFFLLVCISLLEIGNWKFRLNLQ